MVKVTEGVVLLNENLDAGFPSVDVVPSNADKQSCMGHENLGGQVVLKQCDFNSSALQEIQLGMVGSVQVSQDVPSLPAVVPSLLHEDGRVPTGSFSM